MREDGLSLKGAIEFFHPVSLEQAYESLLWNFSLIADIEEDDDPMIVIRVRPGGNLDVIYQD